MENFLFLFHVIQNFSEPGEVEEAYINCVDETTPRNGCNTVKKFMYEEADDCCLTKNSTGNIVLHVIFSTYMFRMTFQVPLQKLFFMFFEKSVQIGSSL